MGTKAAAWMRVSTSEQTASNQRPDIERFCAHHGHELVKVFQVDDSAWDGGGRQYRTALAEVMDRAWKGDYSVVVVWSLDRITRGGAEDALRIIRELRTRGCVLLSVQESWLNGSAEVQDVLVAFAGWQAQAESRRRSERTRAGIERRRAAGLPVGGRKPGAKDSRWHDAVRVLGCPE